MQLSTGRAWRTLTLTNARDTGRSSHEGRAQQPPGSRADAACVAMTAAGGAPSAPSPPRRLDPASWPRRLLASQARSAPRPTLRGVSPTPAPRATCSWPACRTAPTSSAASPPECPSGRCAVASSRAACSAWRSRRGATTARRSTTAPRWPTRSARTPTPTCSWADTAPAVHRATNFGLDPLQRVAHTFASSAGGSLGGSPPQLGTTARPTYVGRRAKERRVGWQP